MRNKLWQGNAEEFTLDLFNDEGVQMDWESNMSSRGIKTESKHRDTADMFGFTALKDSLESPPSPPLRASCNRGATCDNYVCNRLTEAINNRKPP